jgi:potassium-dependent mechanosensitive channel
VLAMGTGPPAQGVAWLVQRSVGISNGSRRALALMIRYAAVAVGIVWALDHVGFNRTAILAVAGGLSVGLGFGIKEVFSNFVSGLWLLFEGSVRPGEVLFIDGDPCEVRSLGLRAAVLAAYHHDPEDVIALLEATARGQNRILATPAPKGLLLRYGDSSIDYALRFWIANPMDNVSICSEVQAAIWRAFRDRQIEIPFPQQVQYQVEGPPKS